MIIRNPQSERGKATIAEGNRLVFDLQRFGDPETTVLDPPVSEEQEEIEVENPEVTESPVDGNGDEPPANDGNVELTPDDLKALSPERFSELPQTIQQKIIKFYQDGERGYYKSREEMANLRKGLESDAEFLKRAKSDPKLLQRINEAVEGYYKPKETPKPAEIPEEYKPLLAILEPYLEQKYGAKIATLEELLDKQSQEKSQENTQSVIMAEVKKLDDAHFKEFKVRLSEKEKDAINMKASTFNFMATDENGKRVSMSEIFDNAYQLVMNVKLVDKETKKTEDKTLKNVLRKKEMSTISIGNKPNPSKPWVRPDGTTDDELLADAMRRKHTEEG